LSINKDELGLLPNAESPLNTNTETKILPRRRHSNASAEKHWQRIGQYCLIHDIVLVYSLTSGVRFLDNPSEQPQMAHWQQSSSIRNRSRFGCGARLQMWSSHRICQTLQVSIIAIAIMLSSTYPASCITLFGGEHPLRSLGTHKALETLAFTCWQGCVVRLMTFVNILEIRASCASTCLGYLPHLRSLVFQYLVV
jgi:hypothetical protein